MNLIVIFRAKKLNSILTAGLHAMVIA